MTVAVAGMGCSGGEVNHNGDHAAPAPASARPFWPFSHRRLLLLLLLLLLQLLLLSLSFATAWLLQ